jgi:hypothetical protein
MRAMGVFRSFLLSSLAMTVAAIPRVAHAQHAMVRSPRSPVDSTAWQRATRHGVPDTSIFAPLELPTPNVYRGGNGAPGPRYWQQRADYDLAATLDTASKTLRGSLTMRYTNNSPDTLTFLWLQTEQNAFRPNSLAELILGAESGTVGETAGDVFDSVTQTVNGTNIPLALRDNETVTKLDLAQPLAPGQVATVHITWHFAVPPSGAGRMGRDGTLYELAQWYPRVCVYDDVKGWNTEPYITNGEFYLEYGDFTLAVTVPASYIVAATGTLDNPSDVLTPVEIDRLARARTSEQPVAIVTAQELRDGRARPSTRGMATWKFHAANVRDVAWAAAPNYQWDASGWNGILAQAYYRPEAAPAWSDAADQARMSIQEYSERWFPYPYPQISAVEGPTPGMEYPMLAMEANAKTKEELYNVVTHEIGHNWFPMIVGSNERLHFWQDEGFNTFINTFSEARRYPNNGDQMARAAQERATIEQTEIANADIPIETPPDRASLHTIGLMEYYKTSVGLQLLRQEIVGPAAFDDAFKTYIRRWAYKHPTPADFYRTMENVTGHQLDWFFREWFVEDPHFDQAVDSVQQHREGDTAVVRVVYGNHARGVLPIRVRLTFSDKSVQDLVYPTQVWFMNSEHYVRTYRVLHKTVTRVDVDPDHRLPDMDRSNNSWTAPVP